MAEQPPTTVDPQDPFQQNIDRLTTAVEVQPPLAVETAPKTRSSRHLYWAIAGLCALVIGTVEVTVLRDGAADQPAPPPAVLAALQKDPCAVRMSAIMNAINAYTTAHGMPPQTLAVLHPDYLPFVPIDPLSNEPYGYKVAGESVSLSCPSAASHTSAARPQVGT